MGKKEGRKSWEKKNRRNRRQWKGRKMEGMREEKKNKK